jgi:hypothetical protein
MEKSTVCHVIWLIEPGGMTREKYCVPFDELCFKKVIRLVERCRVFLQYYHLIWCIRETNGLIEICLGSKPATQTFFLLHFPFRLI